jgi:hypothetical protein
MENNFPVREPIFVKMVLKSPSGGHRVTSFAIAQSIYQIE